MKFNDKEIIEFTDLSTNATIDWILGNYCNFKCSYCFPGCNHGNIRLPKLNDTIKSNLQHIVNELKLAGKDSVVFNLSGGEPTMFHDFNNLANFLHFLGKISLVTNASRTLRWWKEHIHLIDKVIISYHSEFTDVNKLIEVLDFLEEKVELSLHFMVNHKLFDKCISDYKFFSERYRNRACSVELKLIRDPNGRLTSLYTDEQIGALDNIPVPQRKRNFPANKSTPVKNKTVATLEDGTSEQVRPMMIKNLVGSWNGYQCTAHHEFLQIDVQGNIGKMSCGQQYTAITNIFDENFINKFILPKNKLICKNDVCGCIGLFMSGKYK